MSNPEVTSITVEREVCFQVEDQVFTIYQDLGEDSLGQQDSFELSDDSVHGLIAEEEKTIKTTPGRLSTAVLPALIGFSAGGFLTVLTAAERQDLSTRIGAGLGVAAVVGVPLYLLERTSVRTQERANTVAQRRVRLLKGLISTVQDELTA